MCALSYKFYIAFETLSSLIYDGEAAVGLVLSVPIYWGFDVLEFLPDPAAIGNARISIPWKLAEYVTGSTQ